MDAASDVPGYDQPVITVEMAIVDYDRRLSAIHAAAKRGAVELKLAKVNGHLGGQKPCAATALLPPVPPKVAVLNLHLAVCDVKTGAEEV
jgi:hypothetical protein